MSQNTPIDNMSQQKITRSQYIKVPETVLGNRKLTSFGVRLVVYLRKTADKYGKIYKTQQQIADDLGVDIRTVKRAMTGVLGMQYLEKVRRGVYHLPVLVRNMKYCLLPKDALERGLQGVELEIVLYLSLRTDKYGRCSVSQVKMAKNLKHTRSTINTCISNLRDKNVLESERTVRENGSEGLCNYRINYPTKIVKIKKTVANIKRVISDISKPTVRKLAQITKQLGVIQLALLELEKGQSKPTSIYNNKNSRGENSGGFKYTQKKQQAEKRESDYSDFMARCEPFHQDEQQNSDQDWEKFQAQQYSSQQDDNSGQPSQGVNKSDAYAPQNNLKSTLKGLFTGKKKKGFTKPTSSPNQNLAGKTFTLDEMWEVNL